MNLRKLGRNTAHRLAMLRTMCDQLIEHERIETTVAKAKELRRFADKMITLGKEGSLEARRRARAVLRTDESLIKLFGPLAERYREREGGYTRVQQTRQRRGDAAKMAYIEYVDRVGELRPCASNRRLIGSVGSIGSSSGKYKGRINSNSGEKETSSKEDER